MADPVSLAAIGIGATVAGGVTGALGSIFQGNAQAGMYNYQAGVAQVNSTLATQDANYAEATGEVEAQQAGMKTAAEVGTTRAAFGASNVDVNTGSHSQVTASETEIGQENEAIVRSNAAKRAYGFSVQSAEDVAQAGAYKIAADTSKTSGTLSAISTFLGSAGSVSSKWLAANTQGIGSGSGINLSGPASGNWGGAGAWS